MPDLKDAGSASNSAVIAQTADSGSPTELESGALGGVEGPRTDEHAPSRDRSVPGAVTGDAAPPTWNDH